MQLDLENLPAISVDNAAKISELARIGYGKPRDICWSPDGKHLAVITPIGAWIYHMDTNEFIEFLPVPDCLPDSIFASDNTLISFSRLDFNKDYQFKRWDRHTGEVLTTLELDLGKDVLTYRFNHNHSQLAVALYPAVVRLYDMKSGKEISSFDSGVERINSIAFNNGIIGLGSDDGMVVCWNTQTGHSTRLQPQDAGLVYEVAFSPDGSSLAAGYSRGGIRLWDVSTGELRGVIPDYLGARLAHNLVFSFNGGLLAFMTSKRTLQLWEISGVNPVYEIPFDGLLPRLAMRPDSNSIAALLSNQIEVNVTVWEVTSGGLMQTIDDIICPETVMLFQQRKQALLADKDVHIMSLASGSIHTRREIRAKKYCLSPDGTKLATELHCKVTIWDTESWEPIAEVRTHGNGVSDIKFALDNQMLAIGGSIDLVRRAGGKVIQSSVHLWDLRTRTTQMILDDIFGWRLTFSPDGTLLAASGSDDRIHIWDIAAGKETLALPLGTSYAGSRGHYAYMIAGPVFNPDGSMLAVGSPDNEVQLWDMRTAKKIRTLHTPGWIVYNLAFNLDGTLLALTPRIGGGEVSRYGEVVARYDGGWGNILYLWDVHTDKEVARLDGHTYQINSIEFSADGRLLASGCGEGTVRFWGVAGQR